LDHMEQLSVKFPLQLKHFHCNKCVWKCSLRRWRPPFLATMCQRIILWWRKIARQTWFQIGNGYDLSPGSTKP